MFVAYADQFSTVPSTAAARQTGKAALARLKDSSRDSVPARPAEGHWITEGSGYMPRKVCPCGCSDPIGVCVQKGSDDGDTSVMGGMSEAARSVPTRLVSVQAACSAAC